MNYGKGVKQQKVFNLAKWYESEGGRAIHIEEVDARSTGDVSDNKMVFESLLDVSKHKITNFLNYDF